MATDKQINANRLNGKKGGPKTPAGRAAVRHNALTHGLAAEHPVLKRLEKLSDFNKYLDQVRQELQPVGIMEHMLVDQIADAHWRRQRIVKLEIGMFETNSAERKDHIEENYDFMSPEALLHLLAEYDAKGPDMLGRYYRYDARFERSFFKAWKELRVLQAARKAEAEPEVAETEEPEAQPTQSAKQTQIEPRQPSPNPQIPEKPAPKRENDDSIM